MFPKKNRLPAREIPYLLQRGRRFYTKHLKLVVSEGEKASPCQLVILVPLRIDKRAVIRNQMKRLLRETVRKYLAQARAGKQAAIVVQARFLKQETLSIREELKSLFHQAKLID